MNKEKFVTVNKLTKYFFSSSGTVHAVDGVSFEISAGETLGLVGESGCGKSTIGKVLVKLSEPTSGEIIVDGKNMNEFDAEQMKIFRQTVQIIFQDPYSSLDPRLSVYDLIAEPLRINCIASNRHELSKTVTHLMERVGLAKRIMNFYPHELDGGRRQRIGVARALALKPKFIVLDEPVSALDVSIQAQIINLLKELQSEMGLTYLFISHDLSVVKYISDRIAVMYLGEIVETANSDIIFEKPIHPYTRALLSAVPIPRIDIKQELIQIEGEVPSAVNPPEGCRFRGRCIHAIEECKYYRHELTNVDGTHRVACFRKEEFT